MNKQETKEILDYVKKRIPYYFASFSEEGKEAVKTQYELSFKDIPKYVILRCIDMHFRKNTSFPTVETIYELLPIGWEKYWEGKYRGLDTVYYDDTFNQAVDWETVPENVRKKMVYKPNPNNEKRNQLLKNINQLKEKIKNQNVV